MVRWHFGWVTTRHPLGFFRIQDGSRTEPNVDFVITFVLNSINWWCWHQYVCFWGPGMQIWSYLNFLRPSWWCISKTESTDYFVRTCTSPEHRHSRRPVRVTRGITNIGRAAETREGSALPFSRTTRRTPSRPSSNNRRRKTRARAMTPDNGNVTPPTNTMETIGFYIIIYNNW